MKSFATSHPWMTFFLALFGISAAAEVTIALTRGSLRVSGALPAGLNVPRGFVEEALARVKRERGVG